MKKPRRELVGYYKGKAGRSGSIRIALNAKPTKASERIGPTSTRKTSAKFIASDIKSKGFTGRIYRPKASLYHTGPPFETVYYSMIAYRKERAELYWRYRAQKVIIQNLLERLTTYESRIFVTPTATSNILKSFLTKGKAGTTSETGQTKTFPKSSGFRWHVDSMFKEEPNRSKRKKRALKFAPGHGLTFQDSLDIR